MSDTVIDFVSRECKKQLHEKYHGKWEDVGFKIICSCKCEHKRNSLTLGLVEGPRASASNRSVLPSSQFRDLT